MKSLLQAIAIVFIGVLVMVAGGNANAHHENHRAR